MNNNKYIILYPDNFSFEMYDAKGNTAMPPLLHQHDSFELNYVISGNGINYIEDKKYEMKAGDLYLINNLEHHIAVSEGNLKMKIILFEPSLLWQNTSENLELLAPFYNKSAFFSNKMELGSSEVLRIDSILQNLEEEWTKKECAYKLLIKAKLMELTGILCRYLNQEKTLTNTLVHQNNYERIRPSIAYINENFDKNLSLDVIASVSCMNKSYFSTFFKKVTHMTLWEYVEMIRINRAQLLIMTKGTSITDIALECGFNSISTFNTSFKKITRLTPSQYRKFPALP